MWLKTWYIKELNSTIPICMSSSLASSAMSCFFLFFFFRAELPLSNV